MLSSDLCEYRDAYIVTAPDNAKTNKVAFKNIAPTEREVKTKKHKIVYSSSHFID